MSTKYVHPASIYLTEDECSELLSNVPLTQLKRLARSRGFLFGLKAESEEVRLAMAMIPSEWKTVNTVFESMRSSDGAEKLRPKFIPVDGDLTEALLRMQEGLVKRNEEAKEIISSTLSRDGSIAASATYYEVDPTKSEVYSKTQKKTSFAVRPVEGGIVIDHGACPKGVELADLLARQVATAGQEVEVQEVSLYGIRNPELRSKFFVNLMNSLPNYRSIGSPHVTVARMKPTEPVASASKDDEDEDENGSDYQTALAKSLTISGDNVLETPHFKQASKDGFFISSLRWTGQWVNDTEVFVEFQAGFQNASDATDFQYGVCRSFKSETLNFKNTESRPMTSLERGSLQTLVSDTALKVLSDLKKAVQKPVE